MFIRLPKASLWDVHFFLLPIVYQLKCAAVSTVGIREIFQLRFAAPGH